MAFTDKDRENLTTVCNDVKWIKKEHSQRLKDLEDEDKVLHHRINKVRNIYVGASAGIGVISGAIGFWVKSLKGGN